MYVNTIISMSMTHCFISFCLSHFLLSFQRNVWSIRSVVREYFLYNIILPLCGSNEMATVPEQTGKTYIENIHHILRLLEYEWSHAMALIGVKCFGAQILSNNAKDHGKKGERKERRDISRAILYGIFHFTSISYNMLN